MSPAAAGNVPFHEAGVLQLGLGHHRRRKLLRPHEWARLEALARFHPGSRLISSRRYRAVAFLFDPVIEVLEALHTVTRLGSEPPGSLPNRLEGAAGRARWARYLTHLARSMCRARATFWAWGPGDWAECVGWVDEHVGANALALVAYVLTGRNVMASVPHLRPYANAIALFGAAAERSIERVWEPLHSWGYATSQRRSFAGALARVFLLQRSADVDVIQLHTVREALANAPQSTRNYQRPICRALEHLDVVVGAEAELPRQRTPDGLAGIAAPWVALVQRWAATTPQRNRQSLAGQLLCVGRWLGQRHPAISNPTQWTRALAAEFVGAVDRAMTFEWASPAARAQNHHLVGKPLQARAKAGYLKAVRVFFRDVEEWGWEKIPFDHARALATPPEIAHLIGPAPRVIDDAIWAKLLNAGLNLRLDGDSRSLKYYPEALVRAVALVWLFGGLRADEIRGSVWGVFVPNRVSSTWPALRPQSHRTPWRSWISRPTRPRAHSPSQSTRSLQAQSWPGSGSVRSSRPGSTGRLGSGSTSCLPIERSRSASSTSTAR
jgi:hypothetical protein